MNPILAREIRIRFRDKRAFLLLLGLTAALCVAAGWIYSDAVRLLELDTSYNTRLGMPEITYGFVEQRASEAGRELFRFLAMGNVLAWLLVAPSLTATGLAKERERGLLESLWLSPLRVSSQVLGRLGATLCFLLILQLAALPVYGIALLLGGVSPGEIGLAALIIGMAALFGACLGLWCSARAYRSASALGTVFALIAIWSGVVFMQMNAVAPWRGYNPASFALVFSHPAPLLQFLLAPEAVTRFGAPLMDRGETLRYGLLLQTMLSLLLLWSAIRVASKPLPDRRWSEGNMRIRAWQAKLEATRKRRREQRERQKAQEMVAGALLYEFPVEKFVRFKDPLLSREVRGHFRVRQSGLGTKLLRFGVFLAGAGFWIIVVFNALDKILRHTAGPMLLNGLLTFGILAVAVMASTSLVRERESGTWEGLRLSLLTTPNLIRSKWLSPLITFAYWSAPLWLLLPLCLNWGGKAGLPWPWLALAVLILLASLGTVSAWGLWISRRAPHSAAATSWTLASLLFILAGIPALDSMVHLSRKVTDLVHPLGAYRYNHSYGHDYDDSMYRARRDFEALLSVYHPFTALNVVMDEPSRGNRYRTPYQDATRVSLGLLHLIFCATATVILLRLVTRQSERAEE